jgi:serine/threonine protein kinase
VVVPATVFREQQRAASPQSSRTLEHFDFLAPAQQPDEMGRLGAYRVLKVLGRGGMGVVFQAEDTRLMRPVALKVMLPTMAVDELAKVRFLREARAIAAVEHEHIISIYQVDEDRAVPYIAMPLLKGEPLEALLKREGRLSVAEAVQIGRQTAEALAAAHAAGLVHRDIKPGNIWLEGEDRRVKVLDFGLARALGDGSQLTGSGAIVGTPAYMAPEQAQGELDARSDLFSLGCVLYRMTTGKPAFRGADLMGTLAAVLSVHPPAPHEVEPEVPVELSRFILRLLAKSPNDRPPTAQDVVQALQGGALVSSPAPLWAAQSRAHPVEESPLVAVSSAPSWVAETLSAEVEHAHRQHFPQEAATTTNSPAKPTGDRHGKQRHGSRAPSTAWAPVIAIALALGVGGIVLALILPSRSPPTSRMQEVAPLSHDSAPATFLATLPSPPTLPPVTRAVPATGKSVPPVATAARFHGHEGAIDAIAVSPDHSHILSGGEDGTMRLWDRATGKQLCLFSGVSSPVTAVAFSPDGTLAVSGSNDLAMRLWDVASGKPIASYEGHTGAIKSVAFCPDGRRLLSGGDDNTMRLWDREGHFELRRFVHPSWVRHLSPTADGRYALTTCEDGIVRVWDLETGREVRRLKGHVRDASAGDVLPDGRFAISAGIDQTVRLWDLLGNREARQWPGHEGRPWFLCVTGDGLHAVSGGEEGTVRVWDLTAGTEVCRFQRHCRAGAISQDGRFAVGGDVEGEVHVWELPAEVWAKKEGRVPARPLPVPEGQALQTAVEEVQKLYPITAGTPEQMTELAERMLRRGVETIDRPSIRYVLLKEARQRAAGAGKVDLALEAVHEMAYSFAISGLPAKVEVLEAAGRAASRPEDKLTVLDHVQPILEEAIAADAYDAAERLLQVAGTAARDTMAAQLGAVEEWQRSLGPWRTQQAAMADEVRTLARSPNDRHANLVLGRFNCLEKGNWSGGLALLARGEDVRLKAAALADLKRPQTATARAELGDLWLSLAGAEKDTARLQLLRRAYFWYRQAWTEQTGPAQERLSARLRELQGSTPLMAPALYSWSHLQGHWKGQYDNSAWREYDIDADGHVLDHENRQARLARKGLDFLLDFGDGNLERLHLRMGALMVEHFAPASSFPKRSALGIGRR